MLWTNKTKISLGVKKARGILDKILQMIEEDVYCVDKNHLKCCGKTKLVSDDSAEVDIFIDELVRVWDVSTRK